MCMAILLVLIGLLAFYLNDHLSSWHLVEKLDAHSQVTLAIGWEIIPAFWPLIVVTVLVTLLLVMVYLKVTGKKSLGCSSCPTEK